MPQLFNITTQDKLACAERELKLRRSVYPRWIAAGKLSEEKADYELKVMESIVADYQRERESGR